MCSSLFIAKYKWYKAVLARGLISTHTGQTSDLLNQLQGYNNERNIRYLIFPLSEIHHVSLLIKIFGYLIITKRDMLKPFSDT